MAIASAEGRGATNWVWVPPDREELCDLVRASLGDAVAFAPPPSSSATAPALVLADLIERPDSLPQAKWTARGAPIVALVASEEQAARALEEGATQAVMPPLDSPMARIALRTAIRDFPSDDPRDVDDEVSEVRDQLQHNARLATIGEISAAVAHEINNPLQFMSVCLAELRTSLVRSVPGHEGAELRSLLDDALEGLERIRSITVELLPFARSSPSEIEEVDLTRVLMRALRMMRNDLRHRARLDCRLDSVPRLRGDPRRLAQVFTNILLNASQAIEEGNADDNHIIVRCRHDTGDEMIRVEVTDSGVGIPPEHLKRVYERFFTTKPSGLGTGLGMSVSNDIVVQHGGRIDITSEVGRGTTVIIELPVTTTLASAIGASEPPRPRERCLRILAIDDDLLVLKSYRRSIGRGHRMTFANDGEDALSVLEIDPDYDVILCDLMMPNMDGPLFYEALTKRYPALTERVVFCSGGTFTPRTEAFVATIDRPLIHKPVSPDELLGYLFDAVETAELGSDDGDD